MKDQTAYIQAGAGVVADSKPELEWKETRNKASALIKTIQLAQDIYDKRRMYMFKELLKKCLRGESLSAEEAEKIMNDIMNGKVPAAQIASVLTILTYRGETVDEIVGFVRGMKNNMNAISLDELNVVDTCGTGGDGASTFNISTASAIVASAAGVKVAKHGNRAVSSKSGSADVLEHLDIWIQGNEKK